MQIAVVLAVGFDSSLMRIRSLNATLEEDPDKFLADIGEELGKAARRSANGKAH
jgi:hypothetical protein